MNRPPTESKRISETQLRDFAGVCFKAAGLRGDHAEQLAELLTNSDLRGVHSHGLRQVPGYCESLRDKLINPNPNCQVLKETATAVLIDGDGGLGYAPMMMATESAITKAKTNGVAVGATCHIGHYGSAGHYVRRAMEAGCTAFSVQGGSSEMGPTDPNNRPPAAYWGNPPLCFGLPGGNEPPLIPDMATCILADYQRGEEFDALQEMIPAAFFKSMGYTGVARGLGGPFVGTDSARAKAVKEKWPRGQAGGVIVVMDIGLFTDPEEFRAGVDNLVRGVRETMAPLRGYDEATLPGTPESRREQEYRRDGAPISSTDIERLNQTAEEFGLPPTMRL